MPQGVVEIKLKTTPVRDKTLGWMINKWKFLRNSWFLGIKLNNFANSMYHEEYLINP